MNAHKVTHRISSPLPRVVSISATAEKGRSAVARILIILGILATVLANGATANAVAPLFDVTESGTCWTTDNGLSINCGGMNLSGAVIIQFGDQGIGYQFYGNPDGEAPLTYTTNSDGSRHYANGGGNTRQILGSGWSSSCFGCDHGWFVFNNSISAPKHFFTIGAPADTTPPTAPTISLASNTDGDVVVTWTGATDNVAVTGYRYRYDDAMDTGTWTTWSSVVPVVMSDKTLPHSIEVQARDAAGNWSTSAIAVWAGCTVDDVSACNAVAPPGSGANANAYCADTSPGSVESGDWHCIYWSQPTPSRPVHSGTFNVKDFGVDLALKDSVNVIVGWSCLPTGSDDASSITDPASEGIVGFHGQQERTFTVDCGSEWIGSFYVLGGSKPSGGWNAENDTTGTPADWSHVTLWWSYGIPGTLDDPNSDDYVPSPAPAPTSGPSPHPTTNNPNDSSEDPETSDSDGGTSSCEFHWYDPTSYMCGVLNTLKSLLAFVRGLEALIMRVLKLLFIPTGSQMSTWKGSVSGIKSSGVFSLMTTMTNFVSGIFTSAQSEQSCPAPTAGSFDNGTSTVSQTSPIHFCDIIENAGDNMQSSDWGSKIYLGGKILLCFFFALLWFNRISATAGSQMAA